MKRAGQIWPVYEADVPGDGASGLRRAREHAPYRNGRQGVRLMWLLRDGRCGFGRDNASLAQSAALASR